jgi:nucleoside-diphosphate-sugar epimerase
MRVLVTGGTGYLGSYLVQALLAEGHRPRLLVRDASRLDRTVAPLGVDVAALDVVPGDMTDPDAVRAAVDGADAVVHAAAVVAALNRSDAQRTVRTNVEGTRVVVDAALAAGCDPVVHVSSVAALFDPQAAVITADLPPAVHAENPYTRSKALAEQLARELQGHGAALTTVYPGGVCGPAAGTSSGDLAEGFVSMLHSGVVPLKGGGVTVIDVRDVARVIVATLQPGRGPRRYLAGGRLLDMDEIGRLLRQATGRPMPVLPLPGVAFRVLGRGVDVVRKVVAFDTVFTAEAMGLLTHVRPTDDSAVHDDLGVDYRPPIETVEAMVRSLAEAGRISARQAGRLAVRA